MPTYEYACRSCDNHVEVVQSFSDDPLTTCETCGGELRKVFRSVGIVFKGSGFYKTDSRTSTGSKTPTTTPSKDDAAAAPAAASPSESSTASVPSAPATANGSAATASTT